MSEQNREHFDIEAADHLKRLADHPEEAPFIESSICHRIGIHKTGNAYLAPPMLFPLDNETDADHLRRERQTGGQSTVSFDCLTANSETPLRTDIEPGAPKQTVQAAKEGMLFGDMERAANLPN